MKFKFRGGWIDPAKFNTSWTDENVPFRHNTASIISDTTREDPTVACYNNDADHLEHPRRLISAFGFRLLVSCFLHNFYILVSLCSWFDSYFVGSPEDRIS